VFEGMAQKIQNCYRGYRGRVKARETREAMKKVAGQALSAVKIQGAMRGYLSRAYVRKVLEAETRELVLGAHATYIQKIFRGRQVRQRE